MKIVVLNSSPKGKDSITLKYVQYLQKTSSRKDLDWDIENISQRITLLEKKKEELQKVCEAVGRCDAVIWAFPVYVYMVPSALKRFIEAVYANGFSECFNGKYCFSLSTSIHFYDNLAHDYLRAVEEDLGMRVYGAYSAAMDDLQEEEKRRSLQTFFGRFLAVAANQGPTSRLNPPLDWERKDICLGEEKEKLDLGGKKLLVVAEHGEGGNTDKMVERLRNRFFNGETRVLFLDEIDMKGGCLGCMKCSLDNVCAYGDKDDIKEIYEGLYPSADIVVYAGETKDRFLSARWKMFIERRFMKTHQPLMVGKQFGVIVSGPLSRLAHLKTFIEADAQISGANLCGVACDEYGSEAAAEGVDSLCETLLFSSENNYSAPPTFLGVGGKKIFRDEVWGKLRFVFQQDHKYYRRNGWYDFPQKDRKTRLKNAFMMALLSNKKVRESVRSEMASSMLKPFEKILEETGEL